MGRDTQNSGDLKLVRGAMGTHPDGAEQLDLLKLGRALLEDVLEPLLLLLLPLGAAAQADRLPLDGFELLPRAFASRSRAGVRVVACQTLPLVRCDAQPHRYEAL